MADTTISSFINILWPSKKESSQIVLSYPLSEYKGLKSECFLFENLQDLEETALKWSNAKKDVYFGACARKVNLEPHSRGKKDDLVGIPGLWLDLDIRPKGYQSKKYPDTEEAACKILEVFNLEPSVIVESGSGYHAWWLFKEPIWFEAGKYQEYEDLSVKFQKKIHLVANSLGYDLDKTSDLTRVLRLPETINYKYNKKVKLWVSDGPRYSLLELINFIEQKVSKWWPASCNKLVERLLTIQETPVKEYIYNVLHKLPLAKIGNRDTALQSVVSRVVYRSKNLKIPFEDWVVLLTPSVNAMALLSSPSEDPSPTVNTLVEKLTRAFADFERDEVESKTLRLEDMAKKSRTCTDESVLYREEDFLKFSKDLGYLSIDEFQNHLVIQKGSAYYIFFEGRYEGPFTKDEIIVNLYRFLAAVPGIILETLTKEGTPRLRTVPELLRDYCTVAQEVVASLPLQRSYFDKSTQTFYEATCPLRKLSPKYDEQIDTWLNLLGGKEADKLLDWLATTTYLEKPSCALYLSGARSTGKSMLTLGIASLWGSRPTELSKISDSFNADLAKCPVVVADEYIPKSATKSTGELRYFIASYSRTLSRKYLPNSKLEGAIRLVICANNDKLLVMGGGEDLEKEDLQAVAERFLHIKVDSRAADYLKVLGGSKGTQDWVSNDKIARHLVWLTQNRKVEFGNRFLIEGHTTQMHQALAVQDKTSNLVLEWISRYFTQPPAAIKSVSIICGNGVLALNASEIKKWWENYLMDNKLPTINMIGRALKRISNKTRKMFNVWYHEIDIDILINWITENQAGDVDDILARINAQVDFIEVKKEIPLENLKVN